MDTVRDALPSLPTLSGLPQPFSSLHQLLAAEEADSLRIRVSKTNWWVDVLRIRGSAVLRIWRAVTVVTLWSTFITVADLTYGRKLSLSNNVTPLLSVVVGLMLVFRNGAAYSRWDEGRKTFIKLTSTVRSLARLTWINVGAPGPAKATDGMTERKADEGISDKDRRSKIKAMRMMVAFVVATKHHIRREYGLDHEDLNSLLPSGFQNMARSTGFGWGAAEADAAMTPHSPAESFGSEIRRLSSHGSLKAHDYAQQQTSHGSTLQRPTSPRSAHSAERAPLLINRHSGRAQGHSTHRSTDSAVILADYMAKPSLPLPLVIAHQLSLYFAACKRKGLLESVGPAGYNALQASVATCVEQFTTAQNLATIDIPTVYLVHLKQSVSLLLASLPLVLVKDLGFFTIPFVSLVAFTLMGIEAIASELEQPFGVDASDLPLDLMTAELRNEVEHMLARLPQGCDEWDM